MAERRARFQYASDLSLLVYFEPQISSEAHHNVLTLLRLLDAEPIPGVLNLHPAYGSVLLKFNPLKLRHDDLEEILESYLDRVQDLPLPEPRLIEIPVCYGGEFGPDLPYLAESHGISPRQAIELHSSATYLVSFLGFVPGFAYLSGLPEILATPRLESPRRTVPAGTLAIGGSHTGIYPFPTPGGWRWIGRTPLQMFRADRDEMSLLSIGDRVGFVPISEDQFRRPVWG